MFTAQNLLFAPGHRANRFGKARAAGATEFAVHPMEFGHGVRVHGQKLEAPIIRRYEAIFDAKDRIQHA